MGDVGRRHAKQSGEDGDVARRQLALVLPDLCDLAFGNAQRASDIAARQMRRREARVEPFGIEEQGHGAILCGSAAKPQFGIYLKSGRSSIAAPTTRP